MMGQHLPIILDPMAIAITAFGIKKKAGCGCVKRVDSLNKAGDAALAYFRRLVGRG